MTTALITGASAGLGTSFAEALARDGHDLIVTARRVDRLEALAARLRGTHDVSVAVIAADLAAPDGVETLVAEIAERGLAIDLLVNNAGFGLRGLFADLPIDRQLAMLDVNCRAPMALCHAVLPQMIARRSGRILNVASTAGFQPGPWLAIYYASKAFLLHFSEALHEEVKGQGISVTALCPGPVATEFTDVAGMKDNPLFDRYAASPDDVVAAGLKALAANAAVAIPGASNVVTAALNRLLPRGTIRRLHGRVQRPRKR